MTTKRKHFHPRSIQLFLLGIAFLGVVAFFLSSDAPSADVLSPLSQAGTVRVIVTNEVGTTLQDGVSVNAKNDTGSKKVIQQDGYYVLEARNGEYVIEASASGYEPQTKTVDITPNDTTDITFYLKHK